jgi:hypothetical protein
MSNKDSDFINIISGDIVDIPAFEKEISKQISCISQMKKNSHDVEELLMDALKRRCNDRKNVIQAHLRLKNGTNAQGYTMNCNELTHLAEMTASKVASNAILKRLANFYVRIANLHNQIEQLRHSPPPINNRLREIEGIGMNDHNSKLIVAYEKNEANMREKHSQNHRELDRIMQALFLESEIHPQLTEDDLPALETHVKHIAESGCGCNVIELRRLKIMEALLEERRFNQLMQELQSSIA